MFYEEVRIKQEISDILVCSLNLLCMLYNRKFLITAYLGTNAEVVTSIHCIPFPCTKISQNQIDFESRLLEPGLTVKRSNLAFFFFFFFLLLLLFCLVFCFFFSPLCHLLHCCRDLKHLLYDVC